jgi:ribose-phosphate pyrophosphokinase
MGSSQRDTYLIKARLNNFLDFEKIACAVAAIRNTAFKPQIHLIVPYFLGARSDRQFEVGGTWYLKDIICPAVNSLNLDEIIIVDPHSNVLPNLLKNVTVIKNWDFVYDCIQNQAGHQVDVEAPKFWLVSPDAGAMSKIYDVAKDLCFKGEVVTCVKVREKGKIVKSEVPCADFLGKDIFLIDDICDGGRTFIELGKIIKGLNPGKVNLIVTHGIFSSPKGLFELSQNFDNIYTTNSFQDLNEETCKNHKIKVYDIFESLLKLDYEAVQ